MTCTKIYDHVTILLNVCGVRGSGQTPGPYDPAVILKKRMLVDVNLPGDKAKGIPTVCSFKEPIGRIYIPVMKFTIE